MTLLITRNQIFYKRQGTSPSAVIFLHGDGHNHTIGADILKQFPEHAQLSYDRPGHGKSEEIENRTLEKEADVLHSIIQQEKLDNVTLIGHSGGGAVALTYAKKYPTNSVVLINSFFLSPRKIFWFLPIKLLEKGYLKKANGAQSEHVFGNEKDEKEVHAAVYKHNTRATLATNLAMYPEFDVRKAKLSCPVLSICSQGGLLSFYSHAKKVSKQFPNAKAVGIKGTHTLHLFNKQELHTTLQQNKEFLRM